MYQLSVGQYGGTEHAEPAPQRRVRPGELIVSLNDSVKTSGDAAATASTNAATLAERFGLSRKGGAPDREMLLKLPDDVTAVTSGTTPGSRANAATKTREHHSHRDSRREVPGAAASAGRQRAAAAQARHDPVRQASAQGSGGAQRGSQPDHAHVVDPR